MTQTKAELLQTRHQGDIRLGDADSTHYVGFKAPATVSTSLVWTLPAADGTANYLLKTDGSGNLGWVADSSTDSTKMPLAGGTFTGNVTYNDNLEARFGTGADLKIYHRTSDESAVIKNANDTGFLRILSGDTDSSGILIKNANDDVTYLRAKNHDGVELFFNGSVKFETTNTGATLTGTLVSDGLTVDTNTLHVDATNNRVGIGTTSPSDTVHINSGTGNGCLKLESTDAQADLYIKDNSGEIAISASGDNLLFQNTSSQTERMRLDSSGRLLVGDTTSRTGAKLEASDTGSTGSLSLRRYTANAHPSYIEFFKSRSATLGGETVVQSGDNLGQITWGGSDGTDRAYAAFISASVDGTPGDDDMPGRLVFSTTPDGSATPSERLRISSTGVSKFTGGISQVATAAGALDLDLRTSNYFTKTISGNSTFTFSNPAASGTVSAFTLELTHSSGTVTWPASVKWNSDTAPTLTTGKTHLFMFVTDDGGSRYRGSALVDYVN